MSDLDREAFDAARLAARWAIKDTIGKPIDATPVLARAAITAYLSVMSEKGFRMMPREASAEMGMAGYVAALPVFEGEQCEPNPTDWQNCWQAMFDAHANQGESK